MGVINDENYPYYFEGVMLKNQQVDFTGYMDLNYSGVSDSEFVKMLNQGDIQHILIPLHGEAFSMNSFYVKKPLLSNSVRMAFNEKYFKSL